MKYFALLVTSLCLASCAVMRPRYVAPTDLQKNNLNGPVASIESRYLNLDGYGMDDPDRPTEFDMMIISEYNEQGNITLEETYGYGGTRLSKKDIYVFDDDGLAVRSSEYHDLLNNKLTWVMYDHDDRGRLAGYRSVGGEWAAEFRYGRKGYPASMTSITADTVNHVMVYKYDRRGRLRSEAIGRSETTYSYHRNGKLKEVASRSQVEQYNGNGDMERTIIVIRYHEEGGTESKDAIVEATYRYDHHGNWIVRELFSDGEAYGAWVRNIEYRDE